MCVGDVNFSGCAEKFNGVHKESVTTCTHYESHNETSIRSLIHTSFHTLIILPWIVDDQFLGIRSCKKIQKSTKMSVHDMTYSVG